MFFQVSLRRSRIDRVSFVPVCKSFDAAKKQHDKANARRVDLITLNTPLVEKFQSDKVERKVQWASPEEKEKRAKELDSILENEVSEPLELMNATFRAEHGHSFQLKHRQATEKRPQVESY